MDVDTEAITFRAKNPHGRRSAGIVPRFEMHLPTCEEMDVEH